MIPATLKPSETSPKSQDKDAEKDAKAGGNNDTAVAAKNRNTAKEATKKKPVKPVKARAGETSRHELEKMKEKAGEKAPQDDEDPYLFSDDEEKQSQESSEITVKKFYARSKETASKAKKGKLSPPKQGKGQEKQPSRVEAGKSKPLPPVSKPSANSVGKSAAPRTPRLSAGYDEDFPDLIVEKDSFSEYREREYKFFKSRNSSYTAQTSNNKTPKQNTSVLKSKTGAEKNEKSSLLFTSPVAGEARVNRVKSGKEKAKKQNENSTNQESEKARKSARGKNKTMTVEEEPPAEVESHVTEQLTASPVTRSMARSKQPAKDGQVESTETNVSNAKLPRAGPSKKPASKQKLQNRERQEQTRSKSVRCKKKLLQITSCLFWPMFSKKDSI